MDQPFASMVTQEKAKAALQHAEMAADGAGARTEGTAKADPKADKDVVPAKVAARPWAKMEATPPGSWKRSPGRPPKRQLPGAPAHADIHQEFLTFVHLPVRAHGTGGNANWPWILGKNECTLRWAFQGHVWGLQFRLAFGPGGFGLGISASGFGPSGFRLQGSGFGFGLVVVGFRDSGVGFRHVSTAGFLRRVRFEGFGLGISALGFRFRPEDFGV